MVESARGRVSAALEAAGLMALPADWDERLAAITPEEVAREIAEPLAPFRLERTLTLLSPAAAGQLEAMAQAAAALTRQRFGQVMNLYAPIYLSNFCINRCRYCGFNATHAGERRRLSVPEAVREAEVIAGEGFGDLLLVSGEDPAYVTVEYLTELAGHLRGRFNSLAVEIHALDEAGYRALFAAGIEGVTLYQESYDRATYRAYHPAGPKADYGRRLAAQEACAQAGMRRLGIGALLGLQDWRFEAAAVALHAHTLMRHYWRSRVSISFPRMRPAPEVREAFPHLVGDAAFVQMLLAMRLSFPDAGLVLSTREPAPLRDRLIHLGVTQISAGSRTNPGGYGEDGASTEQFAVADERPVAEVAAQLRAAGFDPVTKDWDVAFR